MLKILLACFIVAAFGLIDTETKKSCPSDPAVLWNEDIGQRPCDSTINPTGDLGDPACYYDRCSINQTVMCGCVDFSQIGGQGEKWVCLYSGCDCPPTETKQMEFCGINGGDFIDKTSLGRYAIAGSGCRLKDGQSCLCQHILDDDDPISEWTFQCRFALSDAIIILPHFWLLVIYLSI